MLGPTSQTALAGSLPFILVFVVTFNVSLLKLYPWLSGGEWARSIHHDLELLPTHTHSFKPRPPAAGSPAASRWKLRLGWPSARGVSGLVFAANAGFAMVFVATVFSSMANIFDPLGRGLALRVATPSILVFLILIAPALEIHALLEAAGWAKTRYRRVLWVLELAAVAGWLGAFWCISGALLMGYAGGRIENFERNLIKGCLARVAIVGVSNMAMLAAFGACSAIWQKFGVRAKTLTAADVARKKTGLAATEEMLYTKEARLANLQRKLGETLPHGFMARVIGTLRNNPDVTESNALQMEISGLQTMRTELSNELFAMETRHAAQIYSKTVLGRLESVWQFVFCTYCLYRIFFTAFKLLRRNLQDSTQAQAPSSDPVTLVVTMMAQNYDPKLDRNAWSALLSVLLSMFMLLASLNGALQTFLTITRAFPTVLLTTARANLPLLVGQVLSTYAISSALMLRTHVPKEVGSVVTEALGAPLDVYDVERWFEAWFLGACVCTFVAIWLGRKFKGDEFDDYDHEPAEKFS